MWLVTDRESVARKAFAHDVLHAHMPRAAKLAACAEFEHRWLRSGLVRALEYAWRIAPLGPGMRALLHRLRNGGVV